MPKIEYLPNTCIVGMRTQLTLADNTPKTIELWKCFKPKVKFINNRTDTDFLSVQIFGMEYYENQIFEKWAAVKVSDFNEIPAYLEGYVIEGGLYAVFIHHGTPVNFGTTLEHIFQQWLPKSIYELDNRPHFEVMDKNYRPDDTHATEEVWVPIREKTKI